jgi:hypothetical protein
VAFCLPNHSLLDQNPVNIIKLALNPFLLDHLRDPSVHELLDLKFILRRSML